MLRPTKQEGQQIRNAAAVAGQSVQAYIIEAVRDRMEKEGNGWAYVYYGAGKGLFWHRVARFYMGEHVPPRVPGDRGSGKKGGVF